MRIALLAFLSLFCTGALASVCTAACDLQYIGQGELITFCSSDNETYTAYQVSLHPRRKIFSSCYSKCGVGIKHVGECGCPNACYSDLNRGTCNTTNSTVKICVCNRGWGGEDCSAIKCPNSCSGRGTCVSQKIADGVKIDVCRCQEGWTAYDCSVQVPSTFRSAKYGTLPYGEVPDSPVYYRDDSYGDKHPIFNTSRVATVKIWVSEENERYLLNPETIYDQEYVPAMFFFDNGIISKYRNVTFRVKGASTRINPKKSWNVKFAAGDTWKGVSALGIKSNIGDRVVTSQLCVEFYRALRVETFRSSVAEFFFNDRYYGVERLEEAIDENFMDSRWDADEGTSMYKLGGPYSMEYYGEDPETYKNLKFMLFDQRSVNLIEQEVGNGNFSDITAYISALNKSTPIATDFLYRHVDINVFLRAMTLETITKNADAYLSTGNNYIQTNIRDNYNPLWMYSASDFDIAMIPLEDSFAPILGLTGDQLRAIMARGITKLYGIDLTQFVLSSNPYDLIGRPGKPLSNAVFRIPNTNKTFTEYIRTFVKQIIIDRPYSTQTRRDAYYRLTRSLVARDRMYAIMPTTASLPGKGLETFDQAQNTTTAWIEERWSYLVANFIANGHATCNSIGQCTCYEYYYGTNCEQFCNVTITQNKTSAWANGSMAYSQFEVTLTVGPNPLYDPIIQIIAYSNYTNVWGVNQVRGSRNLYSIPDYEYDDGKLPANSVFQFNYIINSSKQATIRLYNNACVNTRHDHDDDDDDDEDHDKKDKDHDD